MQSINRDYPAFNPDQILRVQQLFRNTVESPFYNKKQSPFFFPLPRVISLN